MQSPRGNPQSLLIGGLQHQSLGCAQGTQTGTVKHKQLKSIHQRAYFLNELFLNETLGFLLENFFAKLKLDYFSFHRELQNTENNDMFLSSLGFFLDSFCEKKQ